MHQRINQDAEISTCGEAEDHRRNAAVASIGIDLGKTVFHLVALDCHAGVVVRKKFSRSQLLAFTANLPWSLIGMEACSGAHFLATELRDQGHEVKLIPAQFVKPYRKINKNDYVDAEAIAEAVTRHNMRFVPIKTDDQLDLQALHRVRERLVRRRTALINQIRGFLLERGLVFAKRPANLRRQMTLVLVANGRRTIHYQQLSEAMKLVPIWNPWGHFSKLLLASPVIKRDNLPDLASPKSTPSTANATPSEAR